MDMEGANLSKKDTDNKIEYKKYQSSYISRLVGN